MRDWKKVEVFGLNDTEAWRWEVTCSQSHHWMGTELKPGVPDSDSLCFMGPNRGHLLDSGLCASPDLPVEGSPRKRVQGLHQACQCCSDSRGCSCRRLLPLCRHQPGTWP